MRWFWLSLLALAALLLSPVTAQPVVTGWRPPAGCSTNQVIGWNGSAWVCHTVSTFSTNNVIPKGDGTTQVASSITDNGTTITIGDAASDILDVNGDIAKFGTSGGDGGVYITSNSIGFGYAQDSDITTHLNFFGYNAGTTRFRNLQISDGKGAAVATFTGSTKDVTLGRILNLSTPNSTVPILRMGRASATTQWGIGHSPFDTDFSFNHFNGTSWAEDLIQISDVGRLTAISLVVNDNTTLGNGPGDTHTLNGTAIVQQLRGTVESPAQLTATTNDWAIASTTTYARATSNASRIVTGIAGGTSGRMLTICNVGSNDIVFDHENAASSAANRLSMSGNIAWTLQGWTTGTDCIDLKYDATSSRWRMAGHSGRLMPGATFTGNVVAATGLTVQSSGLTTNSASVSTTLGVQGAATFEGDVSIGNANTDTLTITSRINSHVYYTGSAPSLSSCGTGATINGNDRVGTVTGGTGSPTGCTLTFSSAYSTNAPVCVISTNADPGTARVWISAVSTTALTISFNVAQNSFPWSYHCNGRL